MSGRVLGWMSLVLAAAAFGIALAVLLGGPGGTIRAPAAPGTTNVQSPAAGRPMAPTPTTGVAPSVTPESAPALQTSIPAVPVQTDTDTTGGSAFWQLVDDTRREAGDDTARQTKLLEKRLTGLSPDAIVEFSEIRRRLDRRAYTWSVWGAATVMEDGCSDDCFRDFRAYVISLGQTAYERALRNPDSLATVAHGSEAGDWENADDPAPDAYSSVTGNDFPLDDSDLSGRPAGTPLDMDGASLLRRYPRLAARFRR